MKTNKTDSAIEQFIKEIASIDTYGIPSSTAISKLSALVEQAKALSEQSQNQMPDDDEAAFLVSLDGENYTKASNGVRLIWKMSEYEKPIEVHLNCTSEGVITDIYTSGEESALLATDSFEISDAIDRLVDFDMIEDEPEPEQNNQAKSPFWPVIPD